MMISLTTARLVLTELIQYAWIKTKKWPFGFTNLKSHFHLTKTFFIWFNDSPLKLMKDAFNFILKTLLVIKIFKFLSCLFGYVEKTAISER